MLIIFIYIFTRCEPDGVLYCMYYFHSWMVHVYYMIAFSVAQHLQAIYSLHAHRSATGPVGTAEPYTSEPHTVQPTWRYIVLMTDGVYKSLGNFLGVDPHDHSIHSQLLSLIRQADAENTHVPIAKKVLSRIAVLHERTYMMYINSTDIALKQLAVQCSKRDDLTLIVVKLHHE